MKNEAKPPVNSVRLIRKNDMEELPAPPPPPRHGAPPAERPTIFSVDES